MFEDINRCILLTFAVILLFRDSFAIRVYDPDEKKSGPDAATNVDTFTNKSYSPTLESRFGDFGSRKTKLGGSPFKRLDYRLSASSELKINPSLSAPESCARACRVGEPPKICYYHFTLELYTVLGRACELCSPNSTNPIKSHCQCVPADGVERGILTINRMLPGPSIQVCEGDKVIIDVENHMEGAETTIHWHGILQRGTQYYDGAPYVTQCPIQQGNAFRYQWIANPGTHFYHSHSGLQKIDGLHGSIVVRQPPSRDINSKFYDFDLTTHVIFLSDWMHQPANQRFPGLLRTNVGQTPNNILINGMGRYRNPVTGTETNTSLKEFYVTPGKKFRFRIINSFSTVCPAQLSIEGHDMLLIAADGEPVKPVKVNTIISFSGERYDFVLHTKQKQRAYWIQVRGLGFCGNNRIQQLAILKYSKDSEQPTSDPPTYDIGLPQGVVLNPLDAICHEERQDAICVSQLKNARKVDPRILKKKADVKIFLPFKFFRYTTEDLFKPDTYNRFLGISSLTAIDILSGCIDECFDVVVDCAITLEQLMTVFQNRRVLNYFVEACIAATTNDVCTVGGETFGKEGVPIDHVAGNPVISLIDEISYMNPPAPLISQYEDNYPDQFCNGDNKPPNCGNNCMCTHKFDIPLNSIVEIVLVDEVQTPNLSHPFHLHGYTFSVIGTGRSPVKSVQKISLNHALELDREGLLHRQFNLPPSKDTIAVPNNGYVVLRLRADNPGFWFLHCHFLFHIVVGMSVVIQVGDQSDLPPIPVGFPTCGDHLPSISLETNKI